MIIGAIASCGGIFALFWNTSDFHRQTMDRQDAMEHQQVRDEALLAAQANLLATTHDQLTILSEQERQQNDIVRGLQGDVKQVLRQVGGAAPGRVARDTSGGN